VLDLAIAIVLIASFGAFVTIHVALSFALVFFHRPRWKGALALVVPPLAPWWGRAAGRWRLSGAWVFVLVLYFAALLAGRFL
jgi:hypothetical protein